KFLDASAGDAATFRPTICAWNDSLVPQAAWPPKATELEYPVQGVDWCDAAAFCAWAGKRLCGHVDPKQTLPQSEVADASAAQWYLACSGGDTYYYPYGPHYEDVCAGGSDYGGPNGVAIVKSRSGCIGGYPGIYDMSGNVSEWVDSCSGPGMTDFCVA